MSLERMGANDQNKGLLRDDGTGDRLHESESRRPTPNRVNAPHTGGLASRTPTNRERVCEPYAIGKRRYAQRFDSSAAWITRAGDAGRGWRARCCGLPDFGG